MSATQPQEQAAINHLIAWMNEEIACQEKRKKALIDLRESMSHRDPNQCEKVLTRVQEQEERSRARETKVRTIFQAFGKLWGVSPKVLTLRSIGERAGFAGEAILDLRDTLEGTVQQVAAEAKKVSAAARMHRSVILEVLNTLFDNRGGDPLEEQGHLLDAEA